MASGEMGELSLKFTADIADILTKVEAMQSKLNTFSNSTEKALTGLQSAIKGLHGGFEGIASMLEHIGGVAGIAAGAVIAFAGALTASAIKTAEHTNELRILALQAGTSIEAFQTFSGVAEKSGVGSDVAARALSRLNENMALAQDKGSKAALALGQLGVTATDSTEAMVQLLNRVGQLSTEQEKIAALTDVFGMRQARLMLPVLVDITHQYEEMGATMEKLGATPSEKLVEESKEWKAAIHDLHLAWEGIANVIAEVVLPVLIEIVTSLTNAIEKLRTFIHDFSAANLMKSAAGAVARAVLPFGSAEIAAAALNVGGVGDAATPDRSTRGRGSSLSGDQAFNAHYTTTAQLEKQMQAAKAAASAYESEISKLTAEMAKLGGAQDTAFSEVTSLINKAAAAGHAFTEDQKAGMIALAKQVDAAKLGNAIALGQWKDQKDTLEATIKDYTIYAAAIKKTDDEMASFSQKLDDVEAKQQLQLDLIGQTPEAIARANAEFEAQKMIEDELAKLEQQRYDFINNDQYAAAMHVSEAMDQIIDRQDKIVTGAGNAAAAMVRGNQALRDQQAMWNTISGLTDQFFSDITTKGANAFQNLGNSLKKYFVNLLSQLVQQQFVVPILLSISQTAGVGQAGAQALGAGSGSPLSQMGSIFGSGASSGSLLASGVGTVFGEAAGTAFGAAAGAGASAGIATLGIASEAGAAAVGGFAAVAGAGMAVLAAAMPYVAIALIALQMLGVFDKKPTEVTGKFGFGGPPSDFEDQSMVQSKFFGSLGFLDKGTAEFSGKAAQIFDQVVADALDAVATRLAPAQIEHLKTTLQGMDFGSLEGTFSTEDFLQKYGGDVLKEVMTAAFNELSPALGAIVDGFSGTADEMIKFTGSLLSFYDLTKILPDAVATNLTAAIGETQASIDNINRIAVAASIIFGADKADLAQIASDAITTASQSSFEAFMKQGDALDSLVTTTDTSVGSIEKLASATADYGANAVKLLVVIQQLKASIASMFGSTVENIKTSTMTNEEKYAYYQQQASDLENQLKTTTDPAKIAELTSKINELIGKAWDLLSPEEQKALQAEFIKNLGELNTLAQQRLDLATGVVEGDAQAHLDSAADKMTQVAADIAKAADTMNSAANTMNTAAKTPTNVNVNVNVNTSGTEVGNLAGTGP